MLKALHTLTAGGYADTFEGVRTDQRSDARRSSQVIFLWGPQWHKLEPRPGSYQLDQLAGVFLAASLANGDGLKVAMTWLNPYPLEGVNAQWTAGDPKTGAPLDLGPCSPWAKVMGLVLAALDGKHTWGEVRGWAWDPASVQRADELAIEVGARARLDFSLPWGEMNASNPANDQRPGITDPAWQARMMIAAENFHAGVGCARLLGPALLDGPPHNVNWGSGTNLIPSGVRGYVQYADDSYRAKKKLTRDSTCDVRANNHVVPGYTWDQYAIGLLSHLGGWRPRNFGWAHHAYSDLSSGPEWGRSSTEGLTRLLAAHNWPDRAGGRGRVYLTEEGFQAWNDKGEIRAAPGVFDLQRQHLKEHYDAAARSGVVMIWAHYLMFSSVRYPADGTIGWLGLQELDGENVVRRPAYDWWMNAA